jgi:regulation of enolase protein 1 (concanavalin A-like superfamily)
VDTITNSANFATAGIMIRNGTAANASYAFTFVNPADNVSGEGVNFEYRNGAGTSSVSDNSTAGVTAPEWIELVRSGNTFTAYDSTNGSSWAQNGTPITITMGSTVNVGLAVSANTNSALNTAIFTHVSVTPNAFSDADIGSPNAPGSAAYNATSGVWTVAGGGADIFGTADQFNLASQTLTGDGSIVAEVTSIAETNAWAKAGVMLRNDTTSGSAYVTVDVTEANGITFQWRSTAGGNVVSADTVTLAGPTAPYWVELTRAGNVFSAFYSSNGTAWTQIGGTQTITMSSTVLAGMAVTSHDNATLNQATFANVVVKTNFALQIGANLDVNFDTNADPISLGTSGANLTVTEDGDTLNFTGIAGVTVNFVPSATDVLTISGNIAGPIRFTGAGTSDSVNINSGVATFAAGAAGAGIQSIALGTVSIGGGALLVLAPADVSADRTLLTANTLSVQGALDLGNNQIDVHYGTSPDPISSIQSLLAAGYNGGAWNGAGIFSSTVAGANASQSAVIYSVGYADGADGIVNGLSSGLIEILPTLAGDAALAGNVAFGDFQLLSQYFGQPGSWDEGNFTYGSTVNFGDFQLLSQNFGQTPSLAGSAGSSAPQINSLPAVASAAGSNSPASVVPVTDGSDTELPILDGSTSLDGLVRFSDIPLLA